MLAEELLARIDERTTNIYVLAEKQERHLATLNGQVLDNIKSIAAIQARCQERYEPQSRLRHIGTGSGVAGFMGLLLYVFGKCLNWWS